MISVIFVKGDPATRMQRIGLEMPDLRHQVASEGVHSKGNSGYPMPNLLALAFFTRQRKLRQISPLGGGGGISRMIFPEFAGSAFWLPFLLLEKENNEFPGVFRHFLGEGFWGPRIAFSGKEARKMKLICWTAVGPNPQSAQCYFLC